MKKKVQARRKAVNPEVMDRAIRAPLAPVTLYFPKRAELGTIPKPYTYNDACNVIERIGFQAWKSMGYQRKLKELTRI